MITSALINPRSIAVVGGSEDIRKPGGGVVRNLLRQEFKGDLYIVNNRAEYVCGYKTFNAVEELPDIDLAIIAIPAAGCADVVDTLCNKKCCKALIIFSAGFGEDSEEGAKLEMHIKETADQTGATLIGPNCIGVVTPSYAGVFSQPIPRLSSGNGIDLVSGSGATIVSLIEQAMKMGLSFSSVFSIGNSAQTGVEDILEYFDTTYIDGESAPVKMLYIESIANPEKFLRHASSLIGKGAKIAAIKSGYSTAGSRAATSHTGAMATPDIVIDALFTKAGIVRCYSRSELVNVCAALMLPRPAGNRMAIITHAGGPAVMLTDVLSSGGVEIPKIEGRQAENLLKKLYSGSSVNNPIDFLPTGTPEQLEAIIDACESDFDVDAMTVILEKPGLGDIFGFCDVLIKKQRQCKKPIYPVLPSMVNAEKEISYFHSTQGISFFDEVVFGEAFLKIDKAKACTEKAVLPPVDIRIIRNIIDNSPDGYLPPNKVQTILDASGITRVQQVIVDSRIEKFEDALMAAKQMGWPVAMKVIGPLHKSEVDGVSLNISDEILFREEFNRMIRIREVTGIVIQPMLTGNQVFVGAKRETNYGHLIVCGMGGVYIEVRKDISYCLSPVSSAEASKMIHGLKSYNLIRGVRGQEGINEIVFAEIIRRTSALCNVAPEIFEMDINPLMGNMRGLTAVDARIRIERNVR